MKNQYKNPSGAFTVVMVLTWLITTTLFGDYVVSVPINPIIQIASSLAYLALSFFTGAVVAGYVINKSAQKPISNQKSNKNK